VLQQSNAALQLEISQESDGQLVLARAAQLGFVTPPQGSPRFLTASPADADTALRTMRVPNPAAASTAASAIPTASSGSGAAATGAGTTSAATTGTVPAATTTPTGTANGTTASPGAGTVAPATGATAPSTPAAGGASAPVGPQG
jgi:hypothetical protein